MHQRLKWFMLAMTGVISWRGLVEKEKGPRGGHSDWTGSERSAKPHRS